MADQPLALIELAQQAIADDVAHRTERGTPFRTDDLSARMRSREPELARALVALIEDGRDRVARCEVEVERQRQRLRQAAIAFCATPPDDAERIGRAGEELEIAAGVFTRAEQEHAEALEDSGFGYCDACGAVTPIDDLHLFFEDLDGVCPACVEHGEQEAAEIAGKREERKRRRKLQ